MKRRIILTKENKILFSKVAAKAEYIAKLKALLDKQDYEGAAKLRDSFKSVKR